MIAVLKLMEGGYPSRTQFIDLYNMYNIILGNVAVNWLLLLGTSLCYQLSLSDLIPEHFVKHCFVPLGLKIENSGLVRTKFSLKLER